MAMEYIKDMDSLLEIVERGNVISFPYGAEGRAFLEWLREIDRLDKVLCAVQCSWTSVNTILCERPLIYLRLLPHFRETASFIISGPDSAFPRIHKQLSDFGCKTIFCLHADVRKAIKDELNDLQPSDNMESALAARLEERMSALENLSGTQVDVRQINSALEPYRNCNRGKTVVIVGDGETAKYYKPIPDAIHIALDGARPIDGVTFDFRFSRSELDEDGSARIMFTDESLNKTFPLALSDPDANQILYQDVSCHPLSNFDGGGAVCTAVRGIYLPC